MKNFIIIALGYIIPALVMSYVFDSTSIVIYLYPLLVMALLFLISVVIGTSRYAAEKEYIQCRFQELIQIIVVILTSMFSIFAYNEYMASHYDIFIVYVTAILVSLALQICFFRFLMFAMQGDTDKLKQIIDRR